LDAGDCQAAGAAAVSDPVTYTVKVSHWHDGEVNVVVEGIGTSENDCACAVHALLLAADQIARGVPRKKEHFS
jgi:hypothetical protein